MGNDRSRGRTGEQGVALILAILSLMILTFLALALATSTSTELQIATNYRWSQQALYNAEAGIEAGRVILSQEATDNTSWLLVLPQDRGLAWDSGTTPPTPLELGSATGRDFERRECDTRGGTGLGLVVDSQGTRWEYQNAAEGRQIAGAFTLWVRRPLIVNEDGQLRDDPSNKVAILVSEGVAPYTSSSNVTRARQALRVLEVPLGHDLGNVCESGGQEGVTAEGTGFDACGAMGRATAARTLGAAMGRPSGAGTAGSLEALETATGGVVQ